MHTLSFQRLLRSVVSKPHKSLRAILRARRKSITQRAQAQAVAQLHDPLTGLASHTLLRERLSNALRQAERYGYGVGILHFGLDNFARINEAHGAPAGDDVLREVGNRVNRQIRGSDLLSRYEGDEFILLIERLGSASGCERVAEVILRELAALGESATLSASIGILVHRPDPLVASEARNTQIDRLANQLLKDARNAMRQAKSEGKGRWFVAGAERTSAPRLSADTFANRLLSRAR